jgi:hypothetical protein
MGQKKHIKDILLLSVFITAAFLVGISSLVLNTQTSRNTTATFATSPGDPTPTRYFFPTLTRGPSRPVYQLPDSNRPQYPLFRGVETDTTQETNEPSNESSGKTPGWQLPAIPNLEVKAPKQAIQGQAAMETVERLQSATDKPLETIKLAALTIKAYDQQLETTVDSFFQTIYSGVQNLL